MKDFFHKLILGVLISILGWSLINQMILQMSIVKYIIIEITIVGLYNIELLIRKKYGQQREETG